jgi:hypothetical protein
VTNLSVKYPYIDQAEVVGLSKVCPLLLIGQDNCDLIVSKEVIQVNPDAPAISKTKLGWVIHGLAGNYLK